MRTQSQAPSLRAPGRHTLLPSLPFSFSPTHPSSPLEGSAHLGRAPEDPIREVTWPLIPEQNSSDYWHPRGLTSWHPLVWQRVEPGALGGTPRRGSEAGSPGWSWCLGCKAQGDGQERWSRGSRAQPPPPSLPASWMAQEGSGRGSGGKVMATVLLPGPWHAEGWGEGTSEELIQPP